MVSPRGVERAQERHGVHRDGTLVRGFQVAHPLADASREFLAQLVEEPRGFLVHAHILHGPVQRLVRGHRRVFRPSPALPRDHAVAGCLVVDRVDRGAERRPGLLLEPIGGAGGGLRELDGELSNGGGAVRSARTRPEPAERRHGGLRSRRASAKPEGPKGAPRARTTRPASSPALSAMWSASGTRSALKLDATTRVDQPRSASLPAVEKIRPAIRQVRDERNVRQGNHTLPHASAHSPPAR